MNNNPIKEYLTKTFTNLSKQTIKLYSIKLNQLYKNFNAEYDEDFELLSNFQTIINYINDLDVSIDNKLAFINAIVLIVRNSKNDEVFHTLQKYIKFRNDLSSKKFDKYKDNKKNDNFVEYDELLLATPPPDFKSDMPETILNKMLLWISVRYPLRLSLYNAEIIKSKKGIDDSKNYFYITPRKLYFLMNNFKNVKIIGKQVIEITDKEHIKIFRDYVKYLNKNGLNQFLLWNFFRNPMPLISSEMYAHVLNKLLQKINLNTDTGKGITMNDIRKAYETKLINSDYYKTLTNREKELEHKKLLHSPNIAMMVYNKV
jgi:hypothetical protein